MDDYPPMATHLETDRLSLRPWAEGDAEEYRALITERGTGTPGVEECRDRIRRLLDTTRRTGLALLTVRLHGQDDLLGYCGLIVGRATREEPEIAYELFRRAHGRGYATEAGRAVVTQATATGRGRLWSTVRAWNAPSLRVLAKLGFHRDHVDPDDGRGELVWLTRPLP
ncbi:GNAT family N-acetyltransferase [Actinoalloteichus caeruleus]|uniref:GNAT family N-acetyltransferase n=1 Tax=Actinoalloteichus cyanogriseus TaxID=2893586 RepID=UPI000A6F2C96|nr:GNAT family N-acetyltransferase [Actinoalloteichus caeruleus]